MNFESKRVDLKIKKGFCGVIVVRNIDEKNHLATIEIGAEANVEIIALSNYKKTGEYTTQIKLQKHANSRYNLITQSKAETQQLYNFYLDQDANLEVAILDFDKTNKQAIYTAKLTKPGAKIDFSQAVFTTGNQQKKIYIHQHNQAPFTEALMQNYGVVFEKGHIFIEGAGYIEKKAIQTNNQQQTRLLVLGHEAKAIARPLLYIQENDVQAGHAMSVGTVDEDILFYMLSRGLSEEKARQYLILGAFQPVIAKISDKKIQNKVVKYLQGVI